MEQEIDFWQEFITFLFRSPEGRGLISTFLTALIGVVVRLLLLTGRSMIERRELARLEQRDELEAEVQRIKAWMAEMNIGVNDPEQPETEIGTNVRTNVPQQTEHMCYL